MQVQFKKTLAQSITRHCCSSKKQICMNKKGFKFIKVSTCLGSKGRGPN